MITLRRGWEKRYAPVATGGLRLSKARLYRAIGEEEGLGDRREGEVHISQQGEVTVDWEPLEGVSLRLTKEAEEHSDAEMELLIRDKFAAELDDPEIELEHQGPERWKMLQNLKVEDSELDSPFLFCLSREAATRSDWQKLQAALPERYDTWTVAEDLASLKFEIECGIKRWMGLNDITEHRLVSGKGWMEYSYNAMPPNDEPGDVALIRRWFRKRRMYSNQEEYRFAWLLRSPQWENLPDTIDIELTKTGLALFKTWEPPDR